MDDHLEEVAQHVGMDRRTFVKRLALTTTFAVPVVTSFSMEGLNPVFTKAAAQSGNVF